MNQEQVWDEISEQWNEYRKTPMIRVERFLKERKGKILDLGCGSGRHFVKNKGIIYGVDFSKKMVSLAKRKAKKARIKGLVTKESVDDLHFEDGFFSYAICIAVLHCIESKKKREGAIRELFRVLESGGEALISVWSKNHEALKNKEKETTVSWMIDEKNQEKVERYTYIYDKEELEEELKKVGFNIVKSWEEDNIFILIKKP